MAVSASWTLDPKMNKPLNKRKRSFGSNWRLGLLHITITAVKFFQDLKLGTDGLGLEREELMKGVEMQLEKREAKHR